MSETWRPVKDLEGAYEISSSGRLRSLDREVCYTDGRVFSYKGKVLKTSIGTSGYEVAHVYDIHKKRHTVHVHTLVADAFITTKGECVNHIDGVKTNNDISNLERVSYSYNNKHAVITGLRKNPASGLSSKLSKLSREQVVLLKSKYVKRHEKYNANYFCNLFGVSKPTIYNALSLEL